MLRPILLVAVSLFVDAAETRRRSSPDIGRAIQQGLARLRLGPWAGAQLRQQLRHQKQPSPHPRRSRRRDTARGLLYV